MRNYILEIKKDKVGQKNLQNAWCTFIFELASSASGNKKSAFHNLSHAFFMFISLFDFLNQIFILNLN